MPVRWRLFAVATLTLVVVAAIWGAVLGTARREGGGGRATRPRTPVTATFEVGAAVDEPDAKPGDGQCATASGTCTLRAAVQEANELEGAQQVVVLPGAARTLTITPSGTDEDGNARHGDLDVADDLVIEASPASGARAVVDASGLGDRAFEVHEGAQLTLVRVDLVGGRTDGDGGAVLVAGTLDIDRAVLRGNHASGVGGALAFTPESAGGRLSQVVFDANTATTATALHADVPVRVEWSTVRAGADAGGERPPALAATPPGEVTLVSSVVDAAGAPACAGPVSAEGSNVVADPSCRGGTASTAAATTVADPLLDADGTPTASSPAVDAGDPETCPSPDVAGTYRDPGRCDAGALERGPKQRVVQAFYEEPAGSGFRAPFANAMAAYLLGDAERGAAAIAAGDAGFQASPIDRLEYEGSMYLPIALRLHVIERPPSYESDTASRRTVEGWLRRFVRYCDVRDVWPNQWPEGSESRVIIGASNCLLALEATGGNADPWADLLTARLRAATRTGLLGEIQSQSYTDGSLVAVLNAADRPGRPELNEAARAFLDLYWHDAAHEFIPETGTLGTGGSRLYQPHPDVPISTEPQDDDARGLYYQDASRTRLSDYAALYGWHEQPPREALRNSRTIIAAVSDYVPSPLSHDLAVVDSKDLDHLSRRPGRTGNVGPEEHGVLRHVRATDGWVMATQTYVPDLANYNIAMSESIWFGVSFETSISDRIVVSGIGERKPAKYLNVADYGAINGAMVDDAMIVARDRRRDGEDGARTNSRGVRVYFSAGQVRDNLVRHVDASGVPSGWWGTRAGDSLVAVRAGDDFVPFCASDGYQCANGDVQELRLVDDYRAERDEPSGAVPPPGEVGDANPCSRRGGAVPSECCPPTQDVDCWAPIVVQVVDASRVPDLDALFAVLTEPAPPGGQPRFASDPGTGEVTYRTLGGHELRMARQQRQRSVPLVDGQPVEAPAGFVHDSPYLRLRATDTAATFCAPTPSGPPRCAARPLP